MEAKSQKKNRREESVRTETHGTNGRKEAAAVIFAAHITEKAAAAAEQRGYAFRVAPSAGKKEIAQAVQELFKVTPVAVRVMNRRGKETSVRGTNRRGRRSDKKIAYVYLKEGEAIDIS